MPEPKQKQRQAQMVRLAARIAASSREAWLPRLSIGHGFGGEASDPGRLLIEADDGYFESDRRGEN